ncbi:MAG: bifunctional oligoribonuclease/PAP phosphatase NrnA [Pyrinomonadaceae bacterium MAG19_C2-C3]|nr:bifunctional oligoribonuclease/PAP phosphatase NrnA [Pyrinomonadaceae bacterium MAG19_C2-C3]
MSLRTPSLSFYRHKTFALLTFFGALHGQSTPQIMDIRERNKTRDGIPAQAAQVTNAGRTATAVLEANGTGESYASKPEELARILEARRGERHCIVLQSFPDPDAISSALAHKLIASRFDIECDIGYDGIVSHHENIALIELLDIDLTRICERDELKQYSGSVFVDNQGTTSGLTDRLTEAKVPVVAIVDHHELQNILQAEFTDIRDASATATIYAQYLQALAPLEYGNSEHTRLATALMHGIRSETLGLSRAQPADYLATGYLAEFVDQTTLDSILSVERSRKSMDVIKSALEMREMRENYSVSGVGYVRYEDRDAIPQAADFLLTEENVHTAIVYGIVRKPGEREMIIGSLRTRKPTLNPDAFIKEALGANEKGRFYGGGRREAGGFEIPVGFLAGTFDDEFMRRKWKLYDAQIKRRLWTKIGVHEATEIADAEVEE